MKAQTAVMPWLVNTHVLRRFGTQAPPRDAECVRHADVSTGMINGWRPSAGLAQGFVPWDIVALFATTHPQLFLGWQYLSVDFAPCGGDVPCLR
jgi:hypothetical protein